MPVGRKQQKFPAFFAIPSTYAHDAVKARLAQCNNDVFQALNGDVTTAMSTIPSMSPNATS